jgi:hypothetical protein
LCLRRKNIPTRKKFTFLKSRIVRKANSLAECSISLTDIFGKNDIWLHSDRMIPALHESMIQSCQRALNSEPHTKNHIIAPCFSLFSSFIPEKCTLVKQRHKPHILSGFRLNFSQKTSEVYVSHVFEPISIIHLLSSSKSWSENCFLCLL